MPTLTKDEVLKYISENGGLLQMCQEVRMNLAGMSNSLSDEKLMQHVQYLSHKLFVWTPSLSSYDAVVFLLIHNVMDMYEEYGK